MAGDEVKPVDASDGDADAARAEDLQPARLPEDVLAEVLRRVPPRWLAASRCVCTAWRDAIDARGLLRVDLLPLSLAGLFVHFDEHKYPEFLARPSSLAGARAISGNLSFLPSTTPHVGTVWDDDYDDDWYDYNIKDRSSCFAIAAWLTLPPDGGVLCHRALLPRMAQETCGTVGIWSMIRWYHRTTRWLWPPVCMTVILEMRWTPRWRNLNGHHPYARCMYSHQSRVVGRRSISSEKGVLQGLSVKCEWVTGDPTASIIEEHFMYSAKLI